MTTKNIQWNNFYLLNIKNNSVVWAMQGPFNSDVMAGLVAGGSMLLSEYYIFTKQEVRYVFGGSHGDNNIIELNNVGDVGDHYIYYIDIYEKDTINILPAPGKIGVWLYDRDTDMGITWNLIEVNHMDEFMQGYITICSAFQVNFRDFMLRLPFDSNGVQYDIPEYNIKEYLERIHLHQEK